MATFSTELARRCLKRGIATAASAFAYLTKEATRIASGLIDVLRFERSANAPVDSIKIKWNDSSTQDRYQLRVLLVEDSQVQQKMVAHLLKQLGHAVSVANEGFEALSLVRRDRCYDVILMDCQMPLMDGFQATRLIREMERVTGQQVGIIGISTSCSSDECFTAGMDEFLSKPLNKAILKTVLGRWIREKKGPSERACK